MVAGLAHKTAASVHQPGSVVGQGLCRIQHAAVGLDHTAADQHRVHVGLIGMNNDRLHRVEGRQHIEVGGPQQDDVRLLAGGQGTGHMIEVHGAGVVDGCPLQYI